MGPVVTAGLGPGRPKGSTDERQGAAPPATGLDGPALVYGVSIIVLAFWLVNPTAFVTEDAYFYLVSARRFARGQGQTFSGIFSTNGFHPLWLYMLYGWAAFCQWVRPSSLLSARFVVFPAAACFLWGTRQLLLLARTLRVSAVLTAGVPMLFVGVMGILGSEGLVLYAAASTLLARLAKGDSLASRGKAVVTGLWAGLVVLARLDSIFWIGAFGAWSVIFRETAAPRRRLWLALGACALMLLPYLVSNAIVFGGLVPISGWMKSSFPRLRPVLPALSLLGAYRGYNNPFGHAPIVLALLSYRAWAGRRLLVAPLLFGCLAHDVYTSLFGSYSEWYWYYVLNVMLAALSLALSLALIAARLAPRALVSSLMAVLFALAGLGGLVGLRRHSNLARLHAFGPTKFLNDAGVRDQAVLVGDTPGYIAFYSQAEIVAADFLTGSRRLFDTIADDPNPLRALFRTYRKAGHPFAYVIWDENRWLGASKDWRTLRLFHPKNGHDGEPFGELAMPPPVLIGPGVVVWDVRGLSFEP